MVDLRTLQSRWKELDANIAVDAQHVLQVAAERLANATDVDLGELKSLDATLAGCGKSRADFVRLMEPFVRADSIRQDLSRLGDEDALQAQYEAASRACDAIESEGVTPWNGSTLDATRENSERAALSGRRAAAQRRRGEAEAALQLLRRKRQELAQLEGAVV